MRLFNVASEWAIDLAGFGAAEVERVSASCFKQTLVEDAASVQLLARVRARGFGIAGFLSGRLYERHHRTVSLSPHTPCYRPCRAPSRSPSLRRFEWKVWSLTRIRSLESPLLG